jgi:DNA-binding MarR family transcriptional regulator
VEHAGIRKDEYMHGGIPNDLHGGTKFTPSQRVLVDVIARCRRERSRRFAAESRFFNDPAWDIYVDLAAAGLAGRKVSISSACLASLVPQTTALRYVRLLEAEGLAVRIRDAVDGRRFLLTLTPRGWSEFHGYVSWLDGQSAAIACSLADAATAMLDPPLLDGPRLARSGAALPLRSADGSRGGNA